MKLTKNKLFSLLLIGLFAVSFANVSGALAWIEDCHDLSDWTQANGDSAIDGDHGGWHSSIAYDTIVYDNKFTPATPPSSGWWISYPSSGYSTQRYAGIYRNLEIVEQSDWEIEIALDFDNYSPGTYSHQGGYYIYLLNEQKQPMMQIYYQDGSGSSYEERLNVRAYYYDAAGTSQLVYNPGPATARGIIGNWFIKNQDGHIHCYWPTATTGSVPGTGAWHDITEYASGTDLLQRGTLTYILMIQRSRYRAPTRAYITSVQVEGESPPDPFAGWNHANGDPVIDGDQGGWHSDINYNHVVYGGSLTPETPHSSDWWVSYPTGNWYYPKYSGVYRELNVNEDADWEIILGIDFDNYSPGMYSHQGGFFVYLLNEEKLPMMQLYYSDGSGSTGEQRFNIRAYYYDSAGTQHEVFAPSAGTARSVVDFWTIRQINGHIQSFWPEADTGTVPGTGEWQDLTTMEGGTDLLQRGTLTYLLVIQRSRYRAPTTAYLTSVEVSLSWPPESPSITNLNEVIEGFKIYLSWDVIWGIGTTDYEVNLLLHTEPTLNEAQRVCKWTDGSAHYEQVVQMVEYGQNWYWIQAIASNILGDAENIVGANEINLKACHTPIADTFVDQYPPYTDVNFDDEDIDVHMDYWHRYAYVKFRIDNPTAVSAATLFMKAKTVYQSGPIKVYAVTNDWTEDTVTWNNRPSRTTGNLLDTDFSQTIGGWDSWDIRFAIETESIISLEILTSSDGVGACYYDREDDTQANLPYIELEYYGQVNPTSDPLLKGDDFFTLDQTIWNLHSFYTPESPLRCEDWIYGDDYLFCTDLGPGWSQTNGYDVVHTFENPLSTDFMICTTIYWTAANDLSKFEIWLQLLDSTDNVQFEIGLMDAWTDGTREKFARSGSHFYEQGGLPLSEFASLWVKRVASEVFIGWDNDELLFDINSATITRVRLRMTGDAYNVGVSAGFNQIASCFLPELVSKIMEHNGPETEYDYMFVHNEKTRLYNVDFEIDNLDDTQDAWNDDYGYFNTNPDYAHYPDGDPQSWTFNARSEHIIMHEIPGSNPPDPFNPDHLSLLKHLQRRPFGFSIHFLRDTNYNHVLLKASIQYKTFDEFGVSGWIEISGEEVSTTTISEGKWIQVAVTTEDLGQQVFPANLYAVRVTACAVAEEEGVMKGYWDNAKIYIPQSSQIPISIWDPSIEDFREDGLLRSTIAISNLHCDSNGDCDGNLEVALYGYAPTRYAEYGVSPNTVLEQNCYVHSMRLQVGVINLDEPDDFHDFEHTRGVDDVTLELKTGSHILLYNNLHVTTGEAWDAWMDVLGLLIDTAGLAGNMVSDPVTGAVIEAATFVLDSFLSSYRMDKDDDTATPRREIGWYFTWWSPIRFFPVIVYDTLHFHWGTLTDIPGIEYPFGLAREAVGTYALDFHFKTGFRYQINIVGTLNLGLAAGLLGYRFLIPYDSDGKSTLLPVYPHTVVQSIVIDARTGWTAS
ncbi:MAG: DNRLRE domain-containing protein [Promethearchaeota archaeon]